MRSSLIASTALAAALLAAGPALADQHGAGGSQADAVQTETTERDGTTVTTTTTGGAAEQGQQAAAQPQGVELVGKKVIGQNGDEVGEIKNVLVDSQGQATHVVLGHGGWLGMGEKEIALDLNQLQVSQQDVRVSMTDDQLSALPEYQSPEEAQGQQQQSDMPTREPSPRQDSAANPLPEPTEQPDVPPGVGAPVPPDGTVAGPSGASKDFTPPLADEPMRPRNPSE